MTVRFSQLDAAATEFEGSGTDSRQLSLKAGGVTEGKLGFSWETVDLLASAFTYDGSTRSNYTLVTAASANANVDDNAELLRNGIGGLSRVVTTSATGEFSLSGTTLSVHGDVTTTGDSYTLRYIVGTASGASSSSGILQWAGTLPQNPLEPETDYFQGGSLDPKWEVWDPDGILTVSSSNPGVEFTTTTLGTLRLAGIIQDAPPDNFFTVTARFQMEAPLQQYAGIGLVAGEDLSAGTGSPTLGSFYYGGALTTNDFLNGAFDRWTDYNSFSTTLYRQVNGVASSTGYFRLYVDRVASTIALYFSRDGQAWMRVRTVETYGGIVADILSIGIATLNSSSEDLYSLCDMFRVDITDNPYLPVGGYVGVGGGSRNTYGPYATPPNYPTLYDTHKTSDGPLERLWTGSAWQDRYPGIGNITVPPEAGWTWFNQGTSTVATIGGLRRLLIDNGTVVRGQFRAQPATPYTADIGFKGFVQDNLGAFYFGFHESAGNDQLVIALTGGTSGADRVGVFRQNAWVFNATQYLAADVYNEPTHMLWFRIENTGTNLHFYRLTVQGDAILLYTEAVGTFLTPDNITVGFAPGTPSTAGNSTQSPMLLIHFEEG